MKIKNYDAGFLTVFDETREISFLDLAKISGYQIDTNLEHCWVLYCVRELLKDKSITFNFDTSYYLDGSISEISYGYFINHINRRVIRLSKDGTVDSDYIILFDPRYISAAFYYYASIPGKIKLEDYLSDEDHYYKNYNEKETNITRIK